MGKQTDKPRKLCLKVRKSRVNVVAAKSQAELNFTKDTKTNSKMFFSYISKNRTRKEVVQFK